MNSPILVLDDDLSVNTMIKDILAIDGYHVLQCYSVQQAKKSILDLKPQLVISDINLPDGNGLELLSWHIEQNLNCPIILITGHTDDDYAAKAIDIGCSGFLTKPFDAKDIMRVVNNLLSKELKDKINPEDFVKIPIDDFISGKIVNFPVYLRFSDNRFLKIAHTGMQLEMSRVKKFKDKGIHEMWILSEDFQAYQKMTKTILTAFKSSQRAGPDRIIKLQKHYCELAFEELRILGLAQDHISNGFEVTSELLQLLTLEINLDNLVGDYWETSTRLHSTAINGAIMSVLISQVMGFSNEKIKQSLMLGAFFRDIGLLKLGSPFKDKLPHQLTPEELTKYKSHPLVGKALLESAGYFTPETIRIVLEHHENGNKESYPHKLERTKIFPLARIVGIVDLFLEGVQKRMVQDSSSPKDKKVFLELIPTDGDLIQTGKISSALIALLTRPTLDQARLAFNTKSV
jgi:response regulator RpfG family c-di-GMP phosphodiesterase